MKLSTETSMQLTRKMLDLKQETVLKLLSMLSSMEPETQKLAASSAVLKEMEQNLNDYFSKTRLLLNTYESALNMPLFEDTSKD